MTSNATTTQTKTKGILALVLGAVSIPLAFIPIVGLLLGVAGVVLGFLSRKSEPAARTLALWGIILGFVGIALSIVMFIVNAVVLAQVVGNA